jgi:tetrahydromethanopterin S-methyltransferase subunit G
MDEECVYNENAILEEFKKLQRKLDEIERKVDAVADDVRQIKSRSLT